MVDASNYAWLDKVGELPRMVSKARDLLGTKEVIGKADNPVIIGWAKEVGGDTAQVCTSDSVAWCGLFMAVVAKRAGKTPPAAPYWALNWQKFGLSGGQPELGDVLTFVRTTPAGKKAGHVALYVGEDDECFHVIGGNQSDQVCFTRIDKDRLVAVRQPPYMNRPASIRPYMLAAKGDRSTGEA
jgi:uncharacterized protein (TIGR02594 family)